MTDNCRQTDRQTDRQRQRKSEKDSSFAHSCDRVLTHDFVHLFLFNLRINTNKLKLLSLHRCKLRVLDSFGTDAEFNYKPYKGEIPGGRSPWGDLDLQLPQFMTMYRKYINFKCRKLLNSL